MTTKALRAAASASTIPGTLRARAPRFRATRAEAKRLNRLSFVGAGGALLTFFALVASVITFYAADGGAHMGASAVDLESAGGLVAGLAWAVDLMGIVVLALWAAATASDYSTGWVRILVQAEPRRARLLGGKLAALTGYTVAGTALATVVSVAAAPLLAGANGISTAAWFPGLAETLATVLRAWADLTLSVLVWGVIGLSVATLTRSVTIAIAGGIGYLLVFERLLGLVADEATTYLPGSVLAAVAAGGTASLSYGTALVLAAAYAAGALLLAALVFTRRDVTS
jgi:ABC-2 type transport system permease protein